MKRAPLNTSLRVLLLFTFTAMVILPAAAGDITAGLAVGYKGGFAVRGSFGVMGFAKGFPFGMEGSVGYSGLDPGNAADARRIFVNDATNGTPEKSGHAWDLRLDFVYDLGWLHAGAVYAYGGVRYSMYLGDFVFVGGNEDFEVRSNQWGIGAGLKGTFNMSQRIDFVLSGGLDYCFPAGLSGHDRTYDPSGDNVNPRAGLTYADADGAINQPKLQPSIMIGVSYNF
jgi:hypothetical protein